jgi:hypothetical protein
MSGPAPLSGLYKATWSGTIGTEEIFSYSSWWTAASTFIQEDIADVLSGDVTDMLGQAVTAGPIATLAQGFPEYVAWTQLKVAPWNPATDKLYSGETPAYRVLTDVGTGDETGGMPYQVALAMTTRSVVSGRRKYNRFYLPVVTHFCTDGHGVLQTTVADAFVLWRHLNITARAADTPSVHAVNYNPGLTPFAHAIEDIYLGRRLDTIRRRRNTAPEPRTIDAL